MSENVPEQRLYSVEQTRAIDAAAIEQGGVDGFGLMRRAAAAALDVLRERWPQAHSLCILCGPGNNGGDGFLLGLLAREAGLDVRLLALTEHANGDAQRAREAYIEAGGEVLAAGTHLPAADVYVDALFGSGLNRAPEGRAADVIAAIGGQRAPVMALDVPSGLNADTGAAFEPCVRADATVTFVAWKRGLFTHQGPQQCGFKHLASLDIAEACHSGQPVRTRLLQAPRWPRRHRDAHKGDFGHVLVAGGDHGMGGAVRMAAEAALRVGAGLVSVATRAEHVSSILAARPEIMARAVKQDADLQAMLRNASVVLLGPGLGRGDWGRALYRCVLDSPKPCVLDADALNLLAESSAAMQTPCVLTPHPGEAARLLDCDTAQVQGDRFAAVRRLADRYQATVALKGCGTLVAAPQAPEDVQGDIGVCPWGNPGMASGGMGDVLGGVIAGLMAQGASPSQAARDGVAVHALAGDRAAAEHGERGLLASDLFLPLRALMNDHDET